MKKLVSAMLLAMLVGCSEEKFTGYIVQMEHTPERMCHDDTKTIVQAVFVPTPVVRTHHHEKEKETFVLYVANKYRVRYFYVKRDLFEKVKPGQKITL
jgi:hypothetical protein